jgi:hypothetical protein
MLHCEGDTYLKNIFVAVDGNGTKKEQPLILRRKSCLLEEDPYSGLIQV